MSIISTRPSTSPTPIKPSSSNVETTLHALLHYIKKLVSQGGPNFSDYDELNDAMNTLANFRKSKSFSPEQIQQIIAAFGESLTTQTIQGFGYLKPHGYAGDFEIIDKIYQNYLSPKPELQNWDRFVHNQSAFKAVKNRLSYFLEQIWSLKISKPQGSTILNLASGPGRDMFESFRVIGKSKIHIDCVEQDATAIAYAKSVCQDYLEHISFTHRNACRFVPKKSYDLIWSGGLFDYFNDGLFKRMLKRFFPALNKNGKLVIGNFSEFNPTQSYMDFFDWTLYHRSPDALRKLAIECGIPHDHIWIEQEPEGVNLFLHILKC